MPIVIDPPASPPVEPPSDDDSNLWELLYAALAPLNDPDPDEALLRFCQALCAPLQPVYDLVRERSDGAGWAIAFDVDDAPESVLPWLAQWVGVVLTEEMSVEQRRNEIRKPTGWARGQEPSIRIAVQRTLEDDESLVIIRPRHPEVGRTYIRTLLSQTPNPERTEAIARAAVPAWEVLDYEALTGVTWADIENGWETWGEVEAAFADFKGLEEVLPEELPP